MVLLLAVLVGYAEAESAEPFKVIDVVALLRNSERSLDGISGRLHYSSRAVSTDSKVSTERIAKLYEFRFQGSRQSVLRHNPEPDAPYSHDLWCVNEHYRFTLGKRDKSWILRGVFDLDTDRLQGREHFRAFRDHFKYTNTFARQRLADVLADASFDRQLTPMVEGLYRVDAERLDQNADGLSRLTATIAIAQDKRYAYIKQAQGVVRKGGDRTSLTVENTVKETPEGPELVESKETVKPLDGTSRGETEYVRTYELHQIPPRPDEASFFLSQYGFPEPDISGASSAPPMNRFIVFFVLLLCGVGLIVVGRNVSRRNLPA